MIIADLQTKKPPLPALQASWLIDGHAMKP